MKSALIDTPTLILNTTQQKIAKNNRPRIEKIKKIAKTLGNISAPVNVYASEIRYYEQCYSVADTVRDICKVVAMQELYEESSKYHLTNATLYKNRTQAELGASMI